MYLQLQLSRSVAVLLMISLGEGGAGFLKNQGISSFRDVPKEHSEGVHMNFMEQVKISRQQPRFFVQADRDSNPESVPDLPRGRASDEDIIICFQNPGAKFAGRVFNLADVAMEEVGPGIQATMMQKPRKKTNFVWETRTPKTIGVGVGQITVVQSIVGSTGREGPLSAMPQGNGHRHWS